MRLAYIVLLMLLTTTAWGCQPLPQTEVEETVVGGILCIGHDAGAYVNEIDVLRSGNLEKIKGLNPDSFAEFEYPSRVSPRLCGRDSKFRKVLVVNYASNSRRHVMATSRTYIDDRGMAAVSEIYVLKKTF